RKPLAHVGEAVGRVEGAEARARVIAPQLLGSRRGRQRGETLQEGVDGDGAVSLAAPDDSALESNFDVFGWAKANLFEMHPGIARVNYVLLIRPWIERVRNISMSVQSANHELAAT